MKATEVILAAVLLIHGWMFYRREFPSDSLRLFFIVAILLSLIALTMQITQEGFYQEVPTEASVNDLYPINGAGVVRCSAECHQRYHQCQNTTCRLDPECTAQHCSPDLSQCLHLCADTKTPHHQYRSPINFLLRSR